MLQEEDSGGLQKGLFGTLGECHRLYVHEVKLHEVGKELSECSEPQIPRAHIGL